MATTAEPIASIPESGKSDRDINFSNLRAKADKLTAERDLLAAETERLRAQVAAFTPNSLLGEVGVKEDDYVDGKGALALVNAATTKNSENIKRIVEEAVAEKVKKLEAENLFEKLQVKTQFKFAEVVNEDSIKDLYKTDPHLVEAAEHNPSEMGKMLFLYQEIEKKRKIQDERISIDKHIAKLSAKGKLNESHLSVASHTGAKTDYDVRSKEGLQKMLEDQQKGLISKEAIGDALYELSQKAKKKFY